MSSFYAYQAWYLPGQASMPKLINHYANFFCRKSYLPLLWNTVLCSRKMRRRSFLSVQTPPGDLPQPKEPFTTAGKVGHQWSEPQVAFFSGKHDDGDPFISPDGRSLLLTSSRPDANGKSSQDIWKISRMEDGSWGKPYRLPEPINSSGREYSPRMDHAQNLYFASDREGGFGQGDLYISEFKEGRYLAPANMGPVINEKSGEWNLEISDDGNILIFEASGRPQNLSSYGDLYISFRKGRQWSHPQKPKGTQLYRKRFKSSVYRTKPIAFCK